MSGIYTKSNKLNNIHDTIMYFIMMRKEETEIDDAQMERLK